MCLEKRNSCTLAAFLEIMRRRLAWDIFEDVALISGATVSIANFKDSRITDVIICKKNLESLANISPSLSLSFSQRDASWSVTRDSMEILIHLRSRVKRISLGVIYIMHGYMPRILCIHRSSHVYHVFLSRKKKIRICRYSLMSCEIITLILVANWNLFYHTIKNLIEYDSHTLIIFNVKIWYYVYFNWETRCL